MIKPLLLGLAAYYALLAAVLIVAPQAFYDTVPGVSDTGPFNGHFVRDVGFALLVSAAGLYLGVRRGDRTLALFGTAFPVLHGLYHLLGWGHHAAPGSADVIMELVTTAGLAALAVVLAFRLKGGAA